MLKLNCRERSERKFSFFNFALFPNILASSGQIIYFLSRRGQIIYFLHFKGQNIYFQKVPGPPPPPPSESKCRLLNITIWETVPLAIRKFVKIDLQNKSIQQRSQLLNRKCWKHVNLSTCQPVDLSLPCLIYSAFFLVIIIYSAQHTY